MAVRPDTRDGDPCDRHVRAPVDPDRAAQPNRTVGQRITGAPGPGGNLTGRLEARRSDREWTPSSRIECHERRVDPDRAGAPPRLHAEVPPTGQEGRIADDRADRLDPPEIAAAGFDPLSGGDRR